MRRSNKFLITEKRDKNDILKNILESERQNGAIKTFFYKNMILVKRWAKYSDKKSNKELMLLEIFLRVKSKNNISFMVPEIINDEQAQYQPPYSFRFYDKNLNTINTIGNNSIIYMETANSDMRSAISDANKISNMVSNRLN